MPRKSSKIFRIIAISPLSGCDTKIIKVLKEDEIYYLQSDFQIDKEGVLRYEKSYPEHLYDSRKLRLNISAIAGKNGSGKSTIIEIILMAINNIGCYFKVKDDLQIVNGLIARLYIQMGTCYRITINKDHVQVEKYDESGKLIPDKEGDVNNLHLRQLFYTICMNYSHYAYNFREYIHDKQKDWLSPLFHKNDAYQTPLVINPWRRNGDIVIDRENYLVKSRLLTNLLRPSGQSTYNFRNLTENLRAVSLNLKEDKSKVFDGELYQRSYKENDNPKNRITKIRYGDLKNLKKEDILLAINKEFDFGYEKIATTTNRLKILAMDYLIRKLISVSVKYEEYFGYFIVENDDFNYKKLKKYIYDIVRDRSHIGFKFRQTLNYLRHDHIKLSTDGDVTLDSLSLSIQEVIDKKSNYKDQIIELIPPPIFSVDIHLAAMVGISKGTITVQSLSSGERQMIYSLSSVLYHLFNLDSVSAKSKNKVKYRRVQIILEEIELYFHPELQRNYIKFLRESIISLELKDIAEISICFVTHSPFILSDIPDSCILFLQLIDGQTVQVNKNRKTFAANIHDLLSDTFFMDNGVCGAFAIDEINDTITFLNNWIKYNELTKILEENGDNEEIFDLRDDLLINFAEDPENHLLLIQTIGEPVIKRKLEEMYNEAFPKNLEEEQIRNEITRLQKLLNKP